MARIHDRIYYDLRHEMGQADPGNARTIPTLNELLALNELLGVIVLRADTTYGNNRCYAYFSRTRVEGAGLVRFYNIAPLGDLGEGRMRRLN